MKTAAQLPCHDCGKPKCRCEVPPHWTKNTDKFIRDLRAQVQRMYFNGHKYDSLATAEETRFLLDIIKKQAEALLASNSEGVQL